jgi:hypothetical protein
MAAAVDSPSEERLLKAALEGALAKINVSISGIIVSYDEATRLAVVQPAVYTDKPIEPLEGVPVEFPSGGGYCMIWPLAAGDQCDIIFEQLDPSRFLVTGEVSPANHVRRNGLYAKCVPCALSDAKRAALVAAPGALTIGTADGLTQIVIEAGSIKVGNALAAIPLALATLQDAINSANAIWGAAHTHTSTAPGSPTSPPISPPPTPSPVGSVKVKTDM